MTSVAAAPAGNELEGFAYGARVEYDLVDGTTVHGKIVVPGTDKVGSAHGIELDTDTAWDTMHWIGTGFVRPEGTGAPAAPKPPRPLTPAMARALDQLQGALHGKVRKGNGIAVGTARALHRRGLAYLDETAFENGDWLLTLVEPETQVITDEGLAELPAEEAALLAPLDPRRRYRALRQAHIIARHFGDKDRAAGFPQLAQGRTEALAQRVQIVLAWQEGRLSDREYSRYSDYAGKQWKAARETPTNVWFFGKGHGEPLLVLEAATAEEAEAKADRIIAADPVGYRELTGGYGRRRITVKEWAEARYLPVAS